MLQVAPDSVRYTLRGRLMSELVSCLRVSSEDLHKVRDKAYSRIFFGFERILVFSLRSHRSFVLQTAVGYSQHDRGLQGLRGG